MQFHSKDPVASGFDLLLVTCSTAESPPYAYPHYAQYLLTHWSRSLSFVCHVQLEREHELMRFEGIDVIFYRMLTQMSLPNGEQVALHGLRKGDLGHMRLQLREILL